MENKKGLDYFITKFYGFLYIEKQTLKDFFLSDEIDKWGFFTLLVPVDKSKEILLIAIVNNLSIFDRIEVELLGAEIEPTEFAKAAKWYGNAYKPFYPSADISDFSM